MSSVTPGASIRFRRASWTALALAAALHLTLAALELRGIASSPPAAHRGAAWSALAEAGRNASNGVSPYAPREDGTASPYLPLPGVAYTIGIPASRVDASAGRLALFVLTETAWLLSLLALRRWFRDASSFRLAAALWLTFTPLWSGLRLGATSGLAASALAFLLALHRRPAAFPTAVAATGIPFPLTLLALPAWAAKRRPGAVLLAAGFAATATAILFSLHPGSFRTFADRALEWGAVDPAGFRGFADAAGAWARTNPFAPGLVRGWWIAAGALFVLASAFLTLGASRPRVGPLVTLWCLTWFLASPRASISDLVILLPGCLVWYAQRPSWTIALGLLWLALPSPFPTAYEPAGAAWTLFPLLLLYARASADLGLRESVRARVLRRAPAASTAIPLVTAVLLLAAFGLSWRVFPIDDAYVHLVYARNLVEGHGMTFNPGEPSTGSTAPLWTLVVALLHLLPGPLVPKVLLAALASYLLCVFLVTDCARRLARSFAADRPVLADALALLAGVAFAANGNVLWFASTGMETLFLLALGLGAIRSYAARGFGYRTAAIAGLAAACRPEGLLVGGLLVACELVVRRRPVSERLGPLLVFALLAAPYFLWVRHLTGSWMPSTFYGKTLTFVATGGFHLGAVDDYFRALWGYWYYNVYAMRPALWFAAAGLITAVLAVAHHARRPEAPSRNLAAALLVAGLAAAWGLLHFSAYAIRFRSLYHQSRYVAPLYGVVLVLSAGGAAALLAWKPWRRFRDLGGAWRLLVFAAFLSVPAFSVAQIPFWRGVYHGNLEHIEHVHLAAAEWIAGNTPPEARIAAFDIGVMGYASGRYTADLGGLTDPSVHPYLISRRCGPYLLEKGVGWIAHLENPPSEWYTGIHLDAGRILKQTYAASFEIPGYVQPVLTHSTKVAIFRVEPLEPILPDLDGSEAFHPVDLSPIANASRRGDPFLPGFRLEESLFPDLVETELTWEEIPFRLLREDSRRATVFTTCYQKPFEASVALRPERGSSLWFVVDGGRTTQCLTPCARLTVTFSDGTETTAELVPYSDVWDYWEQEEIPPERVVWQAPGTRQSLSSYGFRLPADRAPTTLTIASPTAGNEGIAVFAVTQVVESARVEGR